MTARVAQNDTHDTHDTSVTTGVVGSRWRASITPWGAIQPWNGGRPLDWFVAAEDRWHRPHDEASVRQVRLGGTPVVETRLRVPNGDIVQHVYSTADHGGLTIVEFTNESPSPVAVATSHSELLTVRPPADVPVQGIELDADAVVFPLGHRSTLRIGLSHRGVVGSLPHSIASVDDVRRGWERQLDGAGTIDVPDEAMVTARRAADAELLLGGPDLTSNARAVASMCRLVGLGEPLDAWLADVVSYAEALFGSWKRGAAVTSGEWAAGWAAAQCLHRGGQARGAADCVVALKLASQRRETGGVTLDEWMAVTDDAHRATLLPMGFRDAWLGQNLSVSQLPVGVGSEVSFAIRWHGARPALLWETVGEHCALRGPGGWSTTDPSGEALLPAP